MKENKIFDLNSVFRLLRLTESGVRRLRISGKNFSLPDEIRRLAIAYEEDTFFTAMEVVKKATKKIKWNPIITRPEIGDYLFLFWNKDTDSYEMLSSDFVFNLYETNFLDDSGNTIMSTEPYYIGAGITHWMELPEPPK